MSHPVLLTLDVNGDGVVTKNEWEQAPELLQKLDANGDFTLTREEMRSVDPPARNTRERPGRRRSGGGGPRAIDIPVSAIELGEPGIAWYGRLDLAKEEAKRSNRPIMFMAAASQCGGVPGVF